jgi:hypothetical protein
MFRTLSRDVAQFVRAGTPVAPEAMSKKCLAISTAAACSAPANAEGLINARLF